MRRSLKVTRRRFLEVLVWVGTVGLAGAAEALGQLGGYRRTDPLARGFVEAVGSGRSARVVGREYLRLAPAENDPRVLVDLICRSDSRRRAQLRCADREERRALLRLQQREDFGSGRVVKVQGWILSETEARLYALTALVCPVARGRSLPTFSGPR